LADCHEAGSGTLALLTWPDFLFRSISSNSIDIQEFQFQIREWHAVCNSTLRSERAVLRITIDDEAMVQRWTLQGRLSGPWVAQLKSNWEKSHGANGHRKYVVDVSGVTFVDLDGERVLAAMIKDGAEFIATGVYTKHVLHMLEKRRQRWIRKFMGCF
jgi:hypothetical protein